MRIRKALAATVGVLALVGCVGLPDSGPVSAGEVEDGTDLGDVEFIAEGPTPGATQEEIVQGFLQAALSPADDFSIARDYLADGFDAEWDPGAGVSLRSGSATLTSADDAMVEAVYDAVGAVDEHGSFTTISDDAARRTFVLIEERGEWRIAAAPDGLVLSRFSFERLFDDQVLQWFAEDRSTFVPEVRWFERSADGLPEAIVDAVLAGPVAWLAPAVWTAADADAVRVGDVVLDDEVAQVTVSFEQVQESSAVELSQLALQIQQAMSRLGVTEVVVGIDGVEGYSASSRDAPAASAPTVDARPLVLAGGDLDYVGQGSSFTADYGIDLGDAGPTSLTVRDADGLAVALVDGEVTRLVPGGTPAVLDDDVVVAPTLDRSGWTWWVPQSSTSAIVASDGERELVLGMPEVQGTIRAVELSRDGTRLAIVSDVAGGTAVWVAGVVRQDGAPTSIAPPLRLPQVAGSPVDVTWANGTSLAVLTGTEEGEQQLVLLAVGGATQQLATSDATITQIAGGIGPSSLLRARSTEGELLVLRSGQWQSTPRLDDVVLVAVQV